MNRTYRVPCREDGVKAWRLLLLVDNDPTVLGYLETGDCNQYEELLTGQGEAPTKEDVEHALRDYNVYAQAH